MMIWLQFYTLNEIYCPGLADVHVDTLSRADGLKKAANTTINSICLCGYDHKCTAYSRYKERALKNATNRNNRRLSKTITSQQEATLLTWYQRELKLQSSRTVSGEGYNLQEK